MDINKALDNIISKYQLDRYYPHYRNMCEAEKILRSVVEEIVYNDKKAVFVGNDRSGIAFIRNISRDYAGIRFLFYDRMDMTLSGLEEAKWEKDEEIYLISYYGAEYVEKWFRLHCLQYEWIYDIFEREGVCCLRDFFSFGRENLLKCVDSALWTFRDRDFVEAIQCELYCQQCKYQNTDNERTKRISLEKCLFLSLYMRNFVIAEEYVSLLSKYDKRYEVMWNEVQDLLAIVKKNISCRKQKDIIFYWLDSLPYGDEHDMPYLQNVMNQSIVFENAFANIGYTHSSLRAMFLGKKDIDDEAYQITKITRENSPVIQFLEEQGYQIKVFSGVLNDKFPATYSSSCFYLFQFAPASRKLWDILAEMMSEEKKTLWLMQAMESHMPFLNSRMQDSYYRDATDHRERYRLARRELDEQLAFYDQMISNETFRIYMSDHGQDYPDVYHVHFNIRHKNLKARKIEGLFSLLDFNTVIRQLISDAGDINEREFIKEYVEIGNFDRYEKGSIGSLFKKQLALNIAWIGLEGIIDKEYMYMRYKTGKEWLQKRKDMPICSPLLFYDCESDVCEPDLLPKYRALVKEFPPQIISDDKFRYSRYLYVLYQNIMKHNNVPERVRMINQLLEDYPDNSIGIRMGGFTSAMLYYVLSKENKKKIWGFIDNSEDCLCSKLHLPVVGYDQMMKLKTIGVRAVLIPSYTYLKMLRNESKTWPEEIDVLDIYDCFDRNGIKCRENFYELKGTEEDYNVGFPFDEDK